MTHMRYWAMTFAVAIGGAFLAIERFAFAPTTAVWIRVVDALAPRTRAPRGNRRAGRPPAGGRRVR